MELAAAVGVDWCERLPKVELHAHLSGSVSPACLHELWLERKQADPALNLPSPLVALVHDKQGRSISTFFQHFGTYVYHFLCSTRANIFALNAVLADFLADGVVYVELRTSVRDLPGNAILGDGPASAADNIAATCAALREWNADAVKGQMQARLILSINRQHDTLSKALEIVKLAIDLRDKGEPVVGIDLSGDVYSPLRDYSKAFALASEAGLPLSLHFAEVPESSSREELETLLSFNPSRLGHVIHTPPDIRQRILERRIPVELLLTCNILGDMLPAAELGPVDTAKPTRNMDDEYRRHHFEYYYNAGHPLSLGTDDVGVFGSKLSEEYALVSNHFGLGREALIDVSRKGVDGIFDPSQKRAVLDLIDAFARKDGASVEA